MRTTWQISHLPGKYNLHYFSWEHVLILIYTHKRPQKGSLWLNREFYSISTVRSLLPLYHRFLIFLSQAVQQLFLMHMDRFRGWSCHYAVSILVAAIAHCWNAPLPAPGACWCTWRAGEERRVDRWGRTALVLSEAQETNQKNRSVHVESPSEPVNTQRRTVGRVGEGNREKWWGLILRIRFVKKENSNSFLKNKC